MFGDDEAPFTFKRMHEFSTVDGFVEITESLSDMIKYLAKEPSVGLFYIQQHTQTAVPNLVILKNTVAEKSRDMSLHTEDSEDSISTVRSMKECGVPIAIDMIMDINKSLAIISTKQPRKGLFSRNPSFGFNMGNSTTPSSSWIHNNGEKTNNYFSGVFKKASTFTWSQAKSEKFGSFSKLPLKFSASSTSGNTMETETERDKLPLSSSAADKIQVEKAEGEEVEVKKSLSSDKMQVLSESFDEFRADKEAKLEEWLGGSELT